MLHGCKSVEASCQANGNGSMSVLVDGAKARGGLVQDPGGVWRAQATIGGARQLGSQAVQEEGTDAYQQKRGSVGGSSGCIQ